MSLVSLLGSLALLVMAFASGGYEDKTFMDYADWLSLALELLGAYLLIRLKSFAEARFAAVGLAWPVWLVVAASLVTAVLDLALDEAALSRLGWQMLLYFAVLTFYGAVIAWLGIRLLRVQNVYPVFRVMAWLDIVGGILLATLILMLVAVLPLLGFIAAMMLVFFNGAAELRGKA